MGCYNTKADKIYYKLPEQLEHHHKLWVQVQGTCVTLVNTTKAQSGITRILSDFTHVSCSACNYASGRSYRNHKNYHSIAPKTFNISPICHQQLVHLHLVRLALSLIAFWQLLIFNMVLLHPRILILIYESFLRFTIA